MSTFAVTLTPISTVKPDNTGVIAYNVFQNVSIDDNNGGIKSLSLTLGPEAQSIAEATAQHLEFFLPSNLISIFAGVFDGETYTVQNTSGGSITGGNIAKYSTKEVVANWAYGSNRLLFDATTTVSATFVEDFLETLRFTFNPTIDYALTFNGFVVGPTFGAHMSIINDVSELDATLSGVPKKAGLAAAIFEAAELTDNSGTLLKELTITSDVDGDVFSLPDRVAWRGGFLELDGTTLRNEATGVAFFDVTGLGTNSLTLTSLYVIALGDTDGNLTIGQAMRMAPEQDAGSAVLEALLLNAVSAGNRSLTVSATDLTAEEVGVFDFTVFAAADTAPTLSGLPSELFGLTQVDAPLDLSSIDIEGDDAGEVLSLTLTPDFGRLSASSGGGVTATTQSNIFRTSVTLTGTADALDAYLDTGAVNFHPSFRTGTELGTLSVTLSDGAFTVDAGDIAITASDTPPSFSTPTALTVTEGQTFVADIDVTDNASREGDGITYSIRNTLPDADLFTIDPVTGVLSFLAPPQFDPPADDNGDGIYVFSVIATDISGLTDDRVFSVTVAEDLSPVAQNDTVTLPEWAMRKIDLLANDDIPAGGVNHISLDTSGTAGRVIDMGDGVVLYDARGVFDHLNDGQIATDSFTYQLTDALGQTATASVTATVRGVTILDQYGTRNDDILSGTAGPDRMFGRLGDDVMTGGAAKDILYGGDGLDTLRGGGGADRLLGQNGADTIFGGAGHDFLGGGTGADSLWGGAGNDRLLGGADADTLIGGDGADQFIFISTAESRPGDADRIVDFEQGVDLIDLSRIDAVDGVAGSAFTFLGTAALSGAGTLRANASGDETYVEADTDGDGTADFLLTLAGILTLTETDFIF